LLESAVRALLAACVLGAGLRVLRVKNVPAQKMAWGLVLAAALAMPLLMRWQWLPAWAEVKLPGAAWLDAAPASAPSSAPSLELTAAAPTPADAEALPAPVSPAASRFPAPVISMSPYDAPPDVEPEPMPARAAVVPSKPSISPDRPALGVLGFAKWLYLAVGAALLLRLLLGLGSSLRLWMQARPVHFVSSVAAEFETPGAIQVRASRRVTSPVNIGSGILLPADYLSWDAEKLRVVLAHERSHVYQRDFYLQLLAGLYAALTWFSPLGWWLKRKLSELGEAISDRAGLEAAASPSAYAQLLLEFAALPHPTFTGVAMAHSTNLSQRIERLLNDSSFRQAFAGGRRALAALLLVPVALFAATGLVRVQAAQIAAQPATALRAPAQQPAPAPTPVTGQSHPDEAQVASQDPSQAAPQPEPAPAAESAPVLAPPSADAAPAFPEPPPLAAPSQDAVPPAAPVPPAPQAAPLPPGDAAPPVPPVPPVMAGNHYHYEYNYDGDAYALVGEPGDRVRYAGDWDGDHKAEIDKARSVAHGHFLWFRHDGKSYIVDDPAAVSQIEAMDKPMEDLGNQMRDMGKQMRDAGQQAREAGRKAREAAANVPAPDLSREMADLDAAVTSLKAAQDGTVTRQQLAEIQRRLSEVQRKLITAQIRVDVNFNLDMGKFGQQQGQFGSQMGKMGAEMGRMARDRDQKVRGIIDESLKDGKARPVQ
jgi:hypothetical protein